MYRRNLPHWYPDGTAVFVTWRLFGTLPRSADRVLDGRGFRDADSQLDRAASGPSWLSEACVAGYAAGALRRAAMERQLCLLHAFVVMPNHVHVLLTPREELPRVTRWIKGVSARRANQLLGRTGRPFCQDESFDRWVRDHREFNRIRRYIEQNPVQAGLVQSPEQWPYSSASAQAEGLCHEVPEM